MTVRFLEGAKSASPSALAYAYSHSRVQFHPALYVLLYSVVVVVMSVPLFWVISLLTPVSLAINWQIAPELSGLLASGELVRGFVQHWRRGSDNRWSALASAAGGGAAGLVLSAVVALRWGESSWAEVLESVGFGVAIFLVIGWLVQYQVREAKENQ